MIISTVIVSAMSLVLLQARFVSAVPREIGVWFNWFEIEVKSDLCTQIYYSIGRISTSTKHNPSQSAMMNFNDQSRYCHAERSEASLRLSSQTLRSAQGDKILPVLVVKNHHCALTTFQTGWYQTRMPSSSSCLICSSVMPSKILKMYSVSAPRGGAGRWM